LLTPISFNQNYRFYERLSDFYLEYHKVLTEVMLFLETPKIIVSVHTHSKNSKAGNIALYRPHLVGNSSSSELLINRLEDSLQEAGVKKFIGDDLSKYGLC